MKFSTIIISCLAGTSTAALIDPLVVTSSSPTADGTSTPSVVTAKGSPLQSQTTIPPTTAATPLPLPSPSDYISTVLYGHNLHRSNHSAVYLIYNSNLAGYASSVASSCNFAHDTSAGGGGYGQNIASYASSDLTNITTALMVEVAINDQWYNSEIEFYLPEYYTQSTPDLDNFESWGHFSQIVWASTTSVGCATQFCPSGSIYTDMDSYFTVCNYQGSGNQDGFYSSNVLEPLGQPPYVPGS